MDINLEEETSYTTRYHEAILKYVKNENCTNRRGLPVTKPDRIPKNILVSSAMASRFGRSYYDPCDLSSDGEEYSMPNNVAETTLGPSQYAARLVTAARRYLDSPLELPQNWGQMNPNLNDYHCDRMEINCTFCSPDMTGWWRQQEAMHSKYTDLSSSASDLFSIIAPGVGVEGRFSPGRDVLSWRQSGTTGETLGETVVIRQFARANDGLQAGADPVLDNTSTDNDVGKKREEEQRKLHRMAKVHDFLQMWQGCQNLRATQKDISHSE